MKKITILACVALAGSLFFTSCKKDYTCTCTRAGLPNQTIPIKATKKDAKAACESSTYKVAGYDCSLD